MISVVVFGRNDAHGYNLAKRAAISINCIAHLLDDPDDEIIFVDCNTPNDLPTFPESIADTLTDRARKVLRVLRVRPAQFERGRNGTAFKVLEPLCRNIGIRRSNPNNRWVLNTNTDMVFTPLQPGTSLSQIVAELPNGFYELPRFEIPETLWESVDRMNPGRTISDFFAWGSRFHINEIVTSGQGILFDNPGDFQLCLRSQLFEINGFNEQMVRGWHVDSNLCKRMWLLNGETGTILDRLYAYHCDHTRIITAGHSAASATSNSFHEFYENVDSPYLPGQSVTWGLPQEKIEEIHLTADFFSRGRNALEQMLPGMERLISKCTLVGNVIDTCMYYDNKHIFPYLADVIINASSAADVGYVGTNNEMLSMICEFRQRLGHSGQVLFDGAAPSSAALCPQPGAWETVSNDILYQRSDMVIFDFSMKELPARINQDGFTVPGICVQVEQYIRLLHRIMTDFAHREKLRRDAGGIQKLFMFIGCHNSSFDLQILQYFDCALTPVSTYIRQGMIRNDAFEARAMVMPFHFYVVGNSAHDYAAWISSHIGRPLGIEEFLTVDGWYKRCFGRNGTPGDQNAFEQLMNTDSGCGRLQMEVAIAEADGEHQTASAIRKIIADHGKWGCRYV